jgi:hypothetical protein
MMVRVTDCLTQPGGDFFKAIALEKEQLQRLALGFREFLKASLDHLFPFQTLVDRVFSLPRFPASRYRCFGCLVQFLMIVEVAGGQVSPAGDGPAIGHLQEPEAGMAFGRIKGFGQPMDEEKDLLQKIVGFGGITKNFVCNAADNPGVTPE